MSVSSLPGPFGMGTMGAGARKWGDTVADMGFSAWQILPLCPVGWGNSPYGSDGAFAGNTLYIDPEDMERRGMISRHDAEACVYEGSPYTADYDFARRTRAGLVDAAFTAAGLAAENETERFLSQNEQVARYALFCAVKEKHGGAPWWEWPEREALPGDIDALAEENRRGMLRFGFAQMLFFRQWAELKRYAADKKIEIIGDLPFYVSPDSSDVWANRRLFRYEEDLVTPSCVAGVPPDYFSADGQLWGNPLYAWDTAHEEVTDWWVGRMKAAGQLYDTVRIDHFRAIASYWEIPYGAKTAREGRWRPGPGAPLVERIYKSCPELSLIAEDLGEYGPEVTELLEKTGLGGMRIIQFGFAPGANSTHLPHNYPRNAVAYVGTHDNNTLLGWLWEASEEERGFALDYCSFSGGDWSTGGYGAPACRAITETVWRSSAYLAVIPFQDMCGFGRDARMNIPGVPEGNWRFRTTDQTIAGIDREYYKKINGVFCR